MKRLLTILLTACLTLGCWVPRVYGQEDIPCYKAEEGELTHLELLRRLCEDFPRPGYQRYPEVPQYFQQDYPHVRYGGWDGNVATHGCGIAALAMLATYMTDTELTPEDLAEPFWDYSSEHGTEFALFDDSPGVLGYYLERRTASMRRVKAALENGQMVVSLQFAENFTTTAHFIVLCGITEEGRILVRDANLYNHTHRFDDTDYYETGFSPAFVDEFSEIYWIYEKKVVRTPGCTRCADPAVQTVPINLQPHYCVKCTRLQNTRDAYHAALEAVRKTPEV